MSRATVSPARTHADTRILLQQSVYCNLEEEDPKPQKGATFIPFMAACAPLIGCSLITPYLRPGMGRDQAWAHSCTCAYSLFIMRAELAQRKPAPSCNGECDHGSPHLTVLVEDWQKCLEPWAENPLSTQSCAVDGKAREFSMPVLWNIEGHESQVPDTDLCALFTCGFDLIWMELTVHCFFLLGVIKCVTVFNIAFLKFYMNFGNNFTETLETFEKLDILEELWTLKRILEVSK